MKVLTILLSFAFLAPCYAVAQERAVHTEAKGIGLDFNFGGGWYKHNPTADDVNGFQHVYIPEGLPRRQHDMATRNAWDLANDHMTDNPLRHGCMYVDIGMRGTIGPDLTLYADLIGEHRGFSGGLYNTSNLVVYPKMKAVFNRSFSLLKQRFYIGLIGGYRDSLRQMEGLNVYNVDVDNATGFVQWKHLRYTFSQIGDMLFTGLGIDDRVSDMISLEALPMGAQWKADVRLSSVINTGYRLSFHEDLSAGFYLPERVRLYGQVSRREMAQMGNNYAWLAGASGKWQNRRLAVKGFLEARFYGAAYNAGYLFEDVYYRPKGPLRPAMDFAGTFLYPLMNMERPYSKWAVFTEYQGRDVSAFNLCADATCKLFDHFFARAQADINYINPSGLKAYWLPFYLAGIGYEVLPDNFFLISLTNKGMNLDKHYQDFYLQKEPSMQIQFTRSFRWL